MAWLSLGTVTFEIRDGDHVVGSAVDVDWPVVNADLLSRHFLLTGRGGVVTVAPTSWDTVMAVNGEQVASNRRLNDGDVIAAGSGRFVFSQDAPRVVGTEPTDNGEAYFIEELAGIAHPLNQQATSIGRDATNAIVVRNPTASRFHASIRREAGGFVLHSMGSAGTVLNNRLMQHPALLHEGDTVEVAFTVFEFTRKAPPAGIEIVPEHESENDDASRKPTLATEWVVDEEGATGDSASPVWAVLGLMWFVLFTTLAWLRCMD